MDCKTRDNTWNFLLLVTEIARFKYNGKEFAGMGELINNAKDDPNFKEFFRSSKRI